MFLGFRKANCPLEDMRYVRMYNGERHFTMEWYYVDENGSPTVVAEEYSGDPSSCVPDVYGFDRYKCVVCDLDFDNWQSASQHCAPEDESDMTLV